MILQCNQGEALYIINSEGIVYHQHEALHIITPQERDTRRCRDEMQKADLGLLFDDIHLR